MSTTPTPSEETIGVYELHSGARVLAVCWNVHNTKAVRKLLVGHGVTDLHDRLRVQRPDGTEFTVWERDFVIETLSGRTHSFPYDEFRRTYTPVPPYSRTTAKTATVTSVTPESTGLDASLAWPENGRIRRGWGGLQ